MYCNVCICSCTPRVNNAHFTYNPHVVLQCTEGSVRLVGGSNDYTGRVEVCVGREWGTVCAEDVSQSTAQEACSQQGFNGDGERDSMY